MLQLGQVPAMVCSGQKVQNRKVLSVVGVIILGPSEGCRPGPGGDGSDGLGRCKVGPILLIKSEIVRFVTEMASARLVSA